MCPETERIIVEQQIVDSLDAMHVDTTRNTTEQVKAYSTISTPPQSSDVGGLMAEDPVSSTTTSNKAPSPPAPLYNPKRVYSKEQLEVLNLLVHRVWIFDLDHRCMRWANDAAVELWNASSLQEMLARDFSDMTKATILRLLEYRNKFEHGQRIYDQWTYYPKGEAETVQVVGSGDRLSADDANPSMLFEGTPAYMDELQPDIVRGIEMLRHLPVPVCQFDMNGKVMFQNPEATRKKRSAELPTTQSTDGTSFQPPGDGESSDGTCTSHRAPFSHNENDDDFLTLFVDRKVGREVLLQMQQNQQKKDGSDEEMTIEIHAQMWTRHGPRWSAVQLRRTSESVTGQAVLLYNSLDMTDAVRAKRAREDSLAKSEFLAIMSHEIRTPLHQVTGFIDLLHQTNLDVEQLSFVHLLKSSAQGLMTVINDVLDFSKLEAGKMKLESIPYEPRSVLEVPMEVARGIRVEVGIETSFLSPEIKCHPMMKVVISDTGIGISEDHQNHIFDKCQQRSVSVARTFGGTGLGLSICKLLIENMGGSIGVNSRLGLGSSFWFTLPAELPNQKDLALQSIEVSTADTGGLHVLVAEDNIVNQKLLTNMLKRMGHTSEVASNGKIAIEMLERGREFDVILMDIQMPVMDGFEATARIRNMGFTALPILGLTASVSRSDFGEFGFNDWLPKPIPMRDLKSRLYRIKSKKRERDTSPLPVVGKGQ